MSEESRKPLGVPDIVSYLAVAACVILSALCLIGSLLKSGYLHDSFAYFLLGESQEHADFVLLLFNVFVIYVAITLIISPLFLVVLCNKMRHSYREGKATGWATTIVCLLAPLASFLPFLVFGGIPFAIGAFLVYYFPGAGGFFLISFIVFAPAILHALAYFLRLLKSSFEGSL